MSPNTKPIQRCSHNLSINVPMADAIATHRRAGRFGVSMGAYVRRCLSSAKFAHASFRIAMRAESADMQAAEILRAVLADGQVTPDEVQSIRAALALVEQSRKLDHIAAGLAEKGGAE